MERINGARSAPSVRDVLCHVLPDVASQDFIDEGLVPDAAAPRFLAKLDERAWIDTNRDQLPRVVSERRPTHTAHRLQLCRRRIGDIREVSLLPRRPRARLINCPGNRSNDAED